MISSLAVPLSSANPYAAAYYNRAVSTTDHVLMSVSFGIDGDDLTTGHRIAGVLSAAGAAGSTQSDYVYQIGPKLKDDDSVYMRAEIHHPSDSTYALIVDDVYCGEDTYPLIFVRMDMDTPTNYVRFSWYTYSSVYNVENDICVWDEEFANISLLPCNNFLYGKNTIDNVVQHTLQAGVESNAQISETMWYLSNSCISAYISGNWQYLRAKAVQGSVARIIRVDGQSYCVGCDNANTDDYDYASASVTWMRDSVSPIVTDQTLWTTEGVTSQEVSAPFS